MPSKKAVHYTVEVQGRKVFWNGMSQAFVGPFVHLFNEYRQVTDRIEDQTLEYLRYGRVLGLTLDLLLEHLDSLDAWGKEAEWLRISVSEPAMATIEDLDGIMGDYVNVICRVEPGEVREGGARIEVFEIEPFDQLHEAMVAADDRKGGSADVWTLDLTVLDVVGRQVKASEDAAEKMVKRAIETLRLYEPMSHASSDGSVSCLIDRGLMAPSLHITESQVSPGRFAIEIREVQVKGLDQPSRFIDQLDSRALYEAVECDIETCAT